MASANSVALVIDALGTRIILSVKAFTVTSERLPLHGVGHGFVPMTISCELGYVFDSTSQTSQPALKKAEYGIYPGLTMIRVSLYVPTPTSNFSGGGRLNR